MTCCAIFVGIGYYYLENRLKPIENKNESVPYYSLPENAGVLFDICSQKTLFYLDFEQNILNVFFIDDSEIEDNYYGYTVDFTVYSDYSLVGDIVDLVGGIDIVSEERLSFTGIQIEEKLSITPEIEQLKRDIIEQIAFKISKNGFTKEDFLYIIENSETDLTIPVCYFWSQHIKDICVNIRFIN